MPRLFSILCLLFLTSACGTYVHTTSSSQIDPDSAPTQKYFLIPGNKDIGEGNLTFRIYAKMTENALRAEGLSRVAAPGDADTIIALSYGIGDKQTRYSEWTNTQIRGGEIRERVRRDRQGRERVVSELAPAQITSQTRTLSSSTYYRWVMLQGLEPTKSDSQGNLYQKWQAETGSRGSSANLSEIMPYLLKTIAPYSRKRTTAVEHGSILFAAENVAEITAQSQQ